jgi:alpha-ketoglutaric semialdehyde dehydrogenase
MEHVRNLIGGERRPALSGDVADNRCPADGELLGTAPRSGASDVDAAVAVAKAAFPAWAAMPAPQRGDILFRALRLFEDNVDRLARALALEEGKILSEASGEIVRAIRYLGYAAGDARRLYGITAPSETAGTLAFTLWRPHGVVGLITPWNFPVCIPVWKLAPALVAGNTVVLKPAPETPWCASLVGELFEQAGLPEGVLGIVHGDAEPAKTLIDHPDVRAISFTGSTQVGRSIERRCGELHKPVQCELGGKNPLIVLADADLDAAAHAIALGAFGSTGQRCTATSRAIVDVAVADDLLARVTELARNVRVGHPLDPQTTMGPSVSERQLETVLSYVEIGRSEAKLVSGGRRLTEGTLARGFFPEPTIFDDVARGARIASEEIFGPVLSVMRFESIDEAVDIANAVDFGLTSAVFTRDVSTAFAMIEALDTGMTQVNAPTVGGEGHLPFGGIKATGVGPREMGPDAWKFYAESKTVYLHHGARRQVPRER